MNVPALTLAASTLLVPALLSPSPAASTADAPPRSSLFGSWKTHGGAVVTTLPCPAGLCLRVATLSPGAPGDTDQNNPDPKLRNRPICNLEIGSGFTPDGDHAANGHVYDPMSGKTYKANLKLDDPNTLKVRGYVGFSALGRTETWTRIADFKPCS